MFRRALRILLVVLALALISVFDFSGGPHPALAGVPSTPTRFDDPVPDVCLPGDCSLREALMSANINPGPDSITLPSGTYSLNIPGADESAGATGDLNVNGELTLTGEGLGEIVIDGGGNDRVISVGQAGDLNLSGVIIRGGQTGTNGGGILNLGALTVRDSVFHSNGADLGGGIASGTGSGRLILDRVTLRDNSAGAGGGLFLADPGSEATIRNSTISENAATTYSGGVHTQSGTHVTMTNVTFSGNSSPPPVALSLSSGAEVTLDSVTIAANNSSAELGAVANYEAELTLQNTIIQDLKQACWGDGLFESQGHNVASDATCNLTGPADQPSTDAMLGPLAGNGGPTQTHALLEGSPAINAGDDDACPFTDQRGYGRVGACDIGAYEFGGAPVTIKQGDVNCDDDVTAVDALIVLRDIALLPTTAQCIDAAGDVNCDGDRTAVDALLVLRHVAALPVSQDEPCPNIGTPV